MDDADTTTVISQVTTLILEYTTQTTTNSLKNSETTPLTVYAAPSTWEGHVQTASKSCENNKVPSIVWMKPMNNATQCSKKKAPLTLQDIAEEMAQGLGLMRHPLQFKTLHQLNELRERKLRRKFDKVNLAALAVQRKAENDFGRVRKLAAQQPSTDQVHNPRQK